MGAGYGRPAWGLKTGIDVESTRAFFLAQAAYDTGRQVNDGVQPNPKGHDRCLRAAGYFRFPGKVLPPESFIGFGWSNELSTTRYKKSADRPEVGGGFDYLPRSCARCPRDFSMRVAMNWVFVGSDWQNGMHGPEISVSIPSLGEKQHWFLEGEVGIYRFHQTITDRGNIVLAQSQSADRASFVVANVGLMYRF